MWGQNSEDKMVALDTSRGRSAKVVSKNSSPNKINGLRVIYWRKVEFCRGFLAIICVVFFLAAITGPKDTTELAAMETASCLKRQGNGEWRASSGISLETFCKIKGATIGLKRACELDPSSC